MIDLNSRIQLSNEVLIQEIEGEAVLLDLRSEQYFGLDEVGLCLWRQLEADSSLRAAHAQLLDAFEVEPDVLERDLLALLADLERAGLVEVLPAD